MSEYQLPLPKPLGPIAEVLERKARELLDAALTIKALAENPAKRAGGHIDRAAVREAGRIAKQIHGIQEQLGWVLYNRTWCVPIELSDMQIPKCCSLAGTSEHDTPLPCSLCGVPAERYFHIFSYPFEWHHSIDICQPCLQHLGAVKFDSNTRCIGNHSTMEDVGRVVALRHYERPLKPKAEKTSAQESQAGVVDVSEIEK